jgi:hypothetical protein
MCFVEVDDTDEDKRETEVWAKRQLQSRDRLFISKETRSVIRAKNRMLVWDTEMQYHMSSATSLQPSGIYFAVDRHRVIYSCAVCTPLNNGNVFLSIPRYA